MQAWSGNLSVSQRKARLRGHDQRETQVMAVRRPPLDQLRSVAEDLGMHMGDEEVNSYDALMQPHYAHYEAVDAMPDYVPAVKYPRAPGYRPEGEENMYNAW